MRVSEDDLSTSIGYWTGDTDEDIPFRLDLALDLRDLRAKHAQALAIIRELVLASSWSGSGVVKRAEVFLKEVGSDT